MAGGPSTALPCRSASRLRNRMLAKVPRIMTSWWPRRAPYGVEARAGATFRSWSQSPAGDHGAIEPAGLMWSVVRSPRGRRRTRAPTISGHRRLIGPHPGEEGRLGDIGRARIPVVAVALRDGQRAPALVAFEDDRVRAPEQLRVDGRPDDVLDLVDATATRRRGRPVHRRTRCRAARWSGRCPPGRRWREATTSGGDAR